MVALPLAIQGCVYAQVVNDLARLEAETVELDLRRDIATRVNGLLLASFFGFQSMMQEKMYGRSPDKVSFPRYLSTIKEKTDELAAILSERVNEKETAANLKKMCAEFLKAFRESQFNPDAHNHIATIFEGLEVNVRLRDSARAFFLALQNAAFQQEQKVSSALGRERDTRTRVRQITDLTVVVDIVVALLLMVFFVRGTVRRLDVLKENTRRIKTDAELLPEAEGDDEVAELDRVFREMARDLSRARSKEKLMNAMLKEGAERLESVLDSVPAALVVCNTDGRIESINPAAEALFLYKPDELAGVEIARLFSKSSRGEGDFMQRLLAATPGKPLALEAVSQQKDYVPVEVSITTFKGPDGDRLLATINDITERFRLEQMKRDFYQMVSHDLRTPLTTISGILQMARMGKYGGAPSDALSQRLEMAERNVERLLQLVTHLLSLDKLEEGQTQLDCEQGSARALIDDSLIAVQALMEAKGLKLELSDQTTDDSVYCDRSLIGQVLVNLLSNAIKYAPEASTIKISIAEIDAGATTGDAHLRFAVADQGPGVPDQAKQAIFARFKQADSARDAKRGFGLGLAICHSIVQLHDGEMGVLDNQPNGSVFWFALKRR